MPAFYTREKSKYGGIVGTIQAFVSTLPATNNPEDFISKLPAGYLRCDGSILAASQYPLLAAVLGIGSQSKFARNADELAETEFQLPDLGSKYIRASNSSGGYLNDEVGNTGQYRAGIACEASVLGSTSKTVTYEGNFKVLGESNLEWEGNPLFVAGDAESQTKNGLATSDGYQAHGHNTGKRAAFNYTGVWSGSPVPETSPFGITGFAVEGANAFTTLDTPEGSTFLSGQHKHTITVPKPSTFSTNTNFIYTMDQQDIDPFGLETTVNLSTSTLTKLDNALAPFILVEYIIKF